MNSSCRNRYIFGSDGRIATRSSRPSPVISPDHRQVKSGSVLAVNVKSAGRLNSESDSG